MQHPVRSGCLERRGSPRVMRHNNLQTAPQISRRPATISAQNRGENGNSSPLKNEYRLSLIILRAHSQIAPKIEMRIPPIANEHATIAHATSTMREKPSHKELLLIGATKAKMTG